MNRITQRERVLRHIEDFGSITTFDAYKEYGITRLSAVIWLLRHEDGLPIESVVECGKNRYGEPTSWYRYYLQGSEFEKQLKEGKDNE